MSNSEDMTPAGLDDEISAMVAHSADHYFDALEKSLGNRRTKLDNKIISNSQLAAIVSYVSSRGAKGLHDIAYKHVRRNKQNLAAKNQDKGGAKPSNPEFWQLMKEVSDKTLKGLPESLHDTAAILFARRLDAEIRYRRIQLGRK